MFFYHHSQQKPQASSFGTPGHCRWQGWGCRALARSAGPGRAWPGLGLPSPQLWPRAPCPGAEASLPCLLQDRARGHTLSPGRGSWWPGPGLCSSNHLGDGSREAFSMGSEVCTELLKSVPLLVQ